MSQSPPMPLVIRDLTKHYGNFTAVDKVSFEMQAGEIFGLLGPNGAGKTTIISIITGLIQASGGSASVFGHDIKHQPDQAKHLFGVVPQEIVGHGFFTVEEVLRFHSGYYGLRKNQRQIDFVLENLELADQRHKLVSALSGGMKRRLLIAKALVHKPKLLLLDEPTAGVDISLRLTLWDFVRELNRNGTAILLTTHYLEEAEELCQRVGIIDHGVLKTVDDTNELIHGMTNRNMFFILKQPVKQLKHKWVLKQDERSIQVEVPAQMSLGDVCDTLKLDVHQIQDVHIKEGNLESAFVKLVGVNNGR